MNRRRRLEIVVLAFGVVFVAVLAYSFRPGRRPSSRGADALPRPPVAGEDGLPMTVSKGFDYTETVGGKRTFRIQAERTVGFGAAAGQVPNSYALEGVSLTLYPEQGQGAPVTVRADKAQYDHRTNDAILSGNVRWSDEKGALGETAKIEFHPNSKGGDLLVPSPVHFSRGTFNVDAKSGRYDVAKRELALEGPIRGAGTGEGSAGLSSIASDRAFYRREEGVIELVGSVSGASRGGDRVDCDAMTLKTEQDGNRVEWARAEGNVRGVLAAASGPTPAARAAGAAASAVERRYFAKTGALFFGPDGAARSLTLSGTPARVEEGSQKIEAETIDVAFEGGHAAAAHARGKVRFDSPENRAESDSANVTFAASGEIASLELSGNVRTQGEGRSAKADRIVQVPARGLWVLTGEKGGSATAESEGSRVSADRIEMDRNRRTLDATGNARAVFVPGKSNENPPTLVGDSSKPTFGKAARMVFDDAAKTATLSGGGTLWQGASSLFGDDITLNDGERVLVAVGHTRTVVSPEPSEPARGEKDRSPSVVTARRVIYRDAEGVAVFEDGVLVTRGPWRATAQKATATFGAARKIDRVELTGDVTLSDSSTGRKGKAERALDLPGEDKTVLRGEPAWVTDAEGNRVAGAVLTITEKGKRVEVTAPEGGKTETIHKTKA
ncbi:MAG TPA: LptA/OstA family protein [Thermoanaerobaculia bacterium]|nr:LptA/OstA family protein [Thermoanaerobaculia bacterium]